MRDENDSEAVYLIGDEDLLEVFVGNSLNVKNDSYIARKVIGIDKNINGDIKSQMFIDKVGGLINIINKILYNKLILLT